MADPATPGYDLPSPEKLFAEPQSGAAHDAVWSSILNPGARILNAMGVGFKEDWGARPMGLDEDSERDLQRLGVFNDYKDGHAQFLKSFNEAVIRPVANTVDMAARLPGALIGAARGGAEQAAYEAQGDQDQYATFTDLRHIAAAPLAVAAGSLQAMEEGALPEFPGGTTPERISEIGAAERVAQASKARALGVVGEGEAGFYGAEPPTPETVQARAEAAQDAGLDAPPLPEPPPPDIHALARRIDPETFDQYDSLALERQTAREELDRLGALNREERPEVVEARRSLNELIGLEPDAPARAGAFEERLQAMAASAPEDLLDRVAEAYDRLDALLNDDTPEMAEARSRMMDADLKMRELAPEVSSAYREAQDMAPKLPSEAPKIEAPGEGKPASAEPTAEAVEAREPAPAPAVPEVQAGTEAAVEAHIAPVAASPEAEAEVAPGSPTGEQKLGDATSDAAAEAETRAEGKRTTSKGPAAGNGVLKAVEGSGERATRSLSEGVEAKAIQDGLTSRFGDLPEYQRVSMAEQAKLAQELIETDPAYAKAVAMGERAAPKGLLPESAFVAVERKALAEGDVDTLRQLATRSKLSTSATTMGQRIRALGERDPASPVGAIQDVQKAREAEFAKKSDLEAAKRATVEEIKAEVRKAASKADAWSDFLDGIKCGGGE